MAEEVKTTPESNEGILVRWNNLVEWKNEVLHQWRLWLAAKVVGNIDNDADMKRLSATFSRLADQEAHQASLEVIDEYRTLVEKLRVKEERLLKKGRVLRKRNIEIDELKTQVGAQEGALEYLLKQKGQTRAEFAAEVRAIERGISEATDEITEKLARNQASLEEIQLIGSAVE
jgi:hypothetical protein